MFFRGVLIENLAVNLVRADVHETRDLVLLRGLKQHMGSQRVGARELHRISERTPDMAFRGQMQHQIHAARGLQHRLVVRDIADDELNSLPGQVSEDEMDVRRIVHLVQNDDLGVLVLLDHGIDHIGADESRAPGNQDFIDGAHVRCSPGPGADAHG